MKLKNLKRKIKKKDEEKMKSFLLEKSVFKQYDA